jgi:hypothetical protein
LYYLGGEIKNEMGGVCGMYVVEKKCIQGFDGKPYIKRPNGKPRSGWEYYIKTNFTTWDWQAQT